MSDNNHEKSVTSAVPLDLLVSNYKLVEAEEKEKLKTIIKPLTDKKRAIAQEIAELKSPVKIGEKIGNDKETFLVSTIKPKYNFGFMLMGYKIKKDGTPGKQLREIYMFRTETWHKVDC